MRLIRIISFLKFILATMETIIGPRIWNCETSNLGSLGLFIEAQNNVKIGFFEFVFLFLYNNPVWYLCRAFTSQKLYNNILFLSVLCKECICKFYSRMFFQLLSRKNSSFLGWYSTVHTGFV